MNKLSEAIDTLQSFVDGGLPVPVYCHEELCMVLEAAWMYHDLREDDE